MRNKINLILIISLFSVHPIIIAQDTTYARQIIKKLCSQEFLGRGYVNNGVNKAADFLVKEFKNIGLKKIGKSYTQTYSFNVNTFPGKISVTLDGKSLKPGTHYLIDPSSSTTKTGYQLFKLDSVTYGATEGRRPAPFKVKLVKKLTLKNRNINKEFMKKYINILTGKDGTGDIYNYENIENIVD